MNADECILLAILPVDDDVDVEVDPLAGKGFDVDANADVETDLGFKFVRLAKADGLSDRMMVD